MNKKFRIIIFFIVLCGLISPNLFSQEGRGRGRIKGKISDEEGNPLAGVEIVAQSLQYSLQLTGKTDKKGEFAILGFGTGRWRVTAKLKGYLPMYVDKNVSQFRENTDIEFNLKKAPEATITNDALVKDIQKAKGLYNKGKFEEALALFETILKENETLLFLKLNIANCYKEMGNREKAAEKFHDIIETLKDSDASYVEELMTRGYIFLAEYYAKKKDFGKAELYFENATNLYKKDECLFYNLGELYTRSDKTEKAIAAFKKAAEINPEWDKAIVKLGYAYLSAGKIKESVGVFEAYIEKFPESKDKAEIEAILPDLKKMVPKE